eukprot:6120960-Amphidinium_carterae.1
MQFQQNVLRTSNLGLAHDIHTMKLQSDHQSGRCGSVRLAPMTSTIAKFAQSRMLCAAHYFIRGTVDID